MASLTISASKREELVSLIEASGREANPAAIESIIALDVDRSGDLSLLEVYNVLEKEVRRLALEQCARSRGPARSTPVAAGSPALMRAALTPRFPRVRLAG